MGNIYIAPTGEIRLIVNDDPTRVIVFNPLDVNFVDAFYQLVYEFEGKIDEYKARIEVLTADKKAVDAHGIPLNMQAKIDLVREACNYLREKIDALFGKGTSDIAFGSAMTLDMFYQFFSGVAPYVKAARDQKTGKYATAPENPRVQLRKLKHRKVMK